MKYETLVDLPNNIRLRIAEIAPSSDMEAWVRTPIPALGGRSVLDVMNEEERDIAEHKVLQMLLKISGYFG